MRRALSLLLATTVLAASPREARAWCRTAAVAQSDPTICVTDATPLFWGVRCIPLALNESALPQGATAAQVRGLLGDAIAQWSNAACAGGRPAVDLSQGPATTAGVAYVSGGANTNVVIFRRDWAAAGLPPSALALTTLTFGAISGEIKDADLAVNLTVPLSVDGTGSNDLPTILVHEVGHVLGIDHSDARAAVMWFGAGRGERRRTLAPDDVAAVCAIHPPGLARPCTRAVPEEGCGCATPGSARSGSASWVAALGVIALRRRRPRGSGVARC